MRTAIIAAAIVIGAAIAPTPAPAVELSPSISSGHPSLGTVRGRWTLCRIHLEEKGYPYAYLRRREARGIVSACQRELWQKHQVAWVRRAG